ncbi:hypothetical protein Nepgr_013356 [Nepenthes gracilis]|uniref:Uncharacterized protein n=1 Tax=Nepenthes gracilis TaxID=150966 RepID=A0AAD3SIQ2_NEPGR|nr:hypothetical protein Nepgr_013356 [Nepenthes gracilis]
MTRSKRCHQRKAHDTCMRAHQLGNITSIAEQTSGITSLQRCGNCSVTDGDPLITELGAAPFNCLQKVQDSKDVVAGTYFKARQPESSNICVPSKIRLMG